MIKQHYIMPEHLEYKQIEETGEFSGYASIFNVCDAAGDIILPGAFATSLDKNNDIKFLWQHNLREPIGCIDRIYEDAYGLFISGRFLLEVARAREAYHLIRSGAIKGLSIGYIVEEVFYEGENRYIKSLHLLEISVVTMPAQQLAQVLEVRQQSGGMLLASAFENLIQKMGGAYE